MSDLPPIIRVPSQTLDEFTRTLMMNDAIVQEERIKTLLRPKPRWLPTYVWQRIIGRLLIIQTEKL